MGAVSMETQESCERHPEKYKLKWSRVREENKTFQE